MLPNADDTPSEFPKFAVHAAVTGAVACDLGVPEFPVLLGSLPLAMSNRPKCSASVRARSGGTAFPTCRCCSLLLP